MAARTSVAPSKQSSSLAVRRTVAGTFAPGSRREFSRFCTRRSIDSSNAPHIVTACPPCVRRIEQTVAIAPSPRIVTCSAIDRIVASAGRSESLPHHAGGDRNQFIQPGGGAFDKGRRDLI